MRERLWVPIDDDDDREVVTVALATLAHVVGPRSGLGEATVTQAYYRLTGYLLTGRIGSDGPHTGD